MFFPYKKLAKSLTVREERAGGASGLGIDKKGLEFERFFDSHISRNFEQEGVIGQDYVVVIASTSSLYLLFYCFAMPLIAREQGENSCLWKTVGRGDP